MTPQIDLRLWWLDHGPDSAIKSVADCADISRSGGHMSDPNRRKSGRLVCAGLFSSLGVVADLSAGGCRVQCKHWRSLPMGGTFHVSLDGEGLATLVRARIVRINRQGLRRFEYGLEFIDLTDEQRKMVVELSRITSVKRAVATIEEAANRAA